MVGPVRLFEDLNAGRDFILSRRNMQTAELSPGIRASIRERFGRDMSADEVVAEIITSVQHEGDAALLRYSEWFDGVSLDSLEVSNDEIDRAFQVVDPDVVSALSLAAQRIRAFHQRQHVATWMDYQPQGALGQIVRPLDRVGLYAPGGSALYPSSLLMTAVPAAVAGVPELVVCTPPQRDGTIAPVTAVAARLAGVHRIYKVGGAQAIAALAYGTESVPRVDKIFGPGNIFVVLAKRQVYGQVAIDNLPGPTETLLIADGTARADICAADMLAQAEHDPMASAIMITTDRTLAEHVLRALDTQLAQLSREDIARESLARNGAIIVVDTLENAFDLANEYAPEHLCLLIADPWASIASVRHAGGVFVGESSPEVLGDYTAGPSHVMPTGRTARFSSPVNVSDFVKIISVIGLNQRGLRELGPAAAMIATAEGLTAHAAAIQRRLSDSE